MEKNSALRLSLIRTVGELCKKNDVLCREVLSNSGIPFFLDILNTNDEETINASTYVVQMILDTLSNAKLAKKVREMKRNARNISNEERKWAINEEQRRQTMVTGK